VYIDRKGWFPVDPADVRKVVLEESLPIDSDKVKALRERLFANWEMNWVGFNYARDFTLPGQQEPNRLPDVSLCRNHAGP
jgi:transglutaminase-like putative cysteine protease